MRFFTFFGLVIIAKCINPVLIADAADFIILMIAIAFLWDILDAFTKKRRKSY